MLLKIVLFILALNLVFLLSTFIKLINGSYLNIEDLERRIDILEKLAEIK